LSGQFGQGAPVTPVTSEPLPPLPGASQAPISDTEMSAINPDQFGNPALPASGPAASVGPANVTGVTQTAGQGATSAGGLLDKGGWLERNGTLVGTGVSGLGTGLMAMAKDQAKDNGVAAIQAKADIARQNYATSGRGLLAQGDMAYLADQPGRPTPTQRFDPRSYSGQWVYDPSQGKIVFVPQQQTA
jgi:hypothetical protein